ncbi:MAG TPA: Pr6Pr family membrane protein [Bacillota bacterium]|nr:Pr6Pr family membrane protein [Bacillota bacterium]
MRVKAVALFRLIFALLTFTAIAVQLIRHNSYGYSLVNFFSYFTNLSNIFIAGVLLYGGYILLRGQKEGKTFELVRGAAVLCMIIVGIVFSILLRKEDLGTLLPWVNTVLHYVMPVVALLDWLLMPPKIVLRRIHLVCWLVFPLGYLTYSLTRGAATNWYAYPFLDPQKVNGYLGVSLYCVAIMIVFLVTGWALILGSAWLQKQRSVRAKR